MPDYPSWSGDLRRLISQLFTAVRYKSDHSIRNRSCSRPEGRSPCQSSDGKKTEVSAMGLGGNPGQVPFELSSGGSIFGGRGEFSRCSLFPSALLLIFNAFLTCRSPSCHDRAHEGQCCQKLTAEQRRSRKLKSLRRYFTGYTYLYIGRCPDWASLSTEIPKHFPSAQGRITGIKHT